MNIEEWRPVVGYEGLYEVSSHGRVRSLYHYGPRKTPKLMKFINNDGYYYLWLYKKQPSGNKRIHSVASLVLEAFVGPRPNKYEVAHENGVPSNNHVSNLSWKTRIENELDKLRHGTGPVLKGTMNLNAKLTDDDVRKIRNLYNPHTFSQRKLAQMFNVSRNAIFRIVNGQAWTHV